MTGMIILTVQGGEIVVQRESGAQDMQDKKSIGLLKMQLYIFK